MNAEDFKTLFRYNAWANRRTVEACAGLRAAQFTKDLESSFRSVRDTLVHIMAVERVWLDRWKLAWDGSFLKAAGFPDIESVRTAWVPIERELLGFVDALSDEGTKRIVPHKNSSGAEFQMPLWELMQHVVNHGTYHRGQITTLVRQAGGKPLATDLVGFYRGRSAVAK
ncbi:MAG: DinB family protein [Candidatus Acidiferrales bacterium]